jgi:multiple sugar transport system substrate-binding protein
MYNNRVYGVWAWTDVRALWYWKDMLAEANVNPESLKTWEGYISSSEKLNAVLKEKGIQSMHLVGASHSPDMWYPYLWMLGGDILEQRDTHQGARTGILHIIVRKESGHWNFCNSRSMQA